MRRASHRFSIASASAVAIASMLAACSQPASHAIVDLSGSYGKRDQLAYSARTGAPVYASPTALYGPQSFPDYAPNSQLAYSEAPTNQVASLGGAQGQFDTYGIVPQPDAPAYSKPVWQTPVTSEAPLPTSPSLQAEMNQAEPLIQVEKVGPQDFAMPAPSQQQPMQEIDNRFESSLLNEDYGDIYSATPKNSAIDSAPLEKVTVAPVSAPAPAPTPQIQSQPLPDLISEQMPPRPGVADDYVTWEKPAPTQQVSQNSPTQPAWQAPANKTPVDMQATYTPQAGYLNETADLFAPQPQQTRLPSPQTVPNRTLNNSGSVPKASDAYPRPYELLRPGIYPEIGAAGQGMVQAPSRTPMPVIAYVAPQQQNPAAYPSADHASVRSYTVQPGDNLYMIAQRSGLTLEALAHENGLSTNSPIRVGQKLRVPSRPRVEMISLESAPSEFSSVSVFEISGDVAREIMGQPMQRASAPTQVRVRPAAKRFAWPIQGDVYKMASGQVEIAPQGGSSVSASAAGRVVHVERGPLGVLVVIEHPDGWRSLTLGLDVSHVRVGDVVAQGSLIGRASRDHRVRFELRDAQSGTADALSQLQG